MNTAKENKIAIIALTKGGASLGKKLLGHFPSSQIYLPERLKGEFGSKKLESGKWKVEKLEGWKVDSGKSAEQNNPEDFLENLNLVEAPVNFFSNWQKTVEEVFRTYREIIFIMATGIVVRAIAPYLRNKREDPAVVVIDEKGRFPISLLSGHVGGANRLCAEVAEFLKVQPVITTATDVNGRAAVDTLAKELGCKIEPPTKVKLFNRFLAEGETVELFTMWPEVVKNLNTEGFAHRPWRGLEEELASKVSCTARKRESTLEPDQKEKQIQGVVIITNRAIKPPQKEHIFLYPQNLVVGVGCRRGVPQEEILEAITEVFERYKLKLVSLKMLASIDLKAKERGLIQAAKVLGVPFKTIPAEKIAHLEGTFQESQFVKKITGVGGVCEPAARILSRKGRIVVPKQKLGRVTVAVAEEKFML